MFVAAPNKVIVRDLELGERTTSGGIILKNDNGTLSGIRSRWAQVYAVGEGITDVQPGQWLLLDHGRWSRTIVYDNVPLNIVDYPKGILLVSDDRPEDHLSFGKNL